jgi:glucose-6-phosphate 1-dehydrogenase
MSDANTPTIFVAFGATGDLMSRKIVPSLFHLMGKGVLPDHFHIVGFSRRDWSHADLREHVRAILADKYPDAPEKDVQRFLGMITYARGSFEDEQAYADLAAHLTEIDTSWGLCTNKVFYLAVPPEHYQTIFERLAASGLTEPCGDLEGWTRVLVEKPFGDDTRTAQLLDDLLARLFREEQIYRIDHYLAKEMLQGIMNFRFTNNLFETAWDRDAIESIEITLHETLGVEKRGKFYDGVGALRDVGQNHLLQMLALVTMDQPEIRGAAAIRTARARAVRELLAPMTVAEVQRDTYRSQYEGFRDIDGVSPESQTETYFKLRTHLRGSRWAGVPVTMESGKRIKDVCKRIIVRLRHPHPCLCEAGVHPQNSVIFTLEPTDTIKIEFWAKKPGFENDLERREFNFFLYEKEEKAQYVEEYARLILDAIRGDQTLFVSTEEVHAMWEFIDPIVEEWHEGAVALESYEPDTQQAPERADAALASPPSRGSVGVIGLGKMGAGIAQNLIDDGWDVTGYNRSPGKTDALKPLGLRPAYSVAELVQALPRPRLVWLMLPAGKPVDDMLFGEGGLTTLLDEGDFVVDGGNSFYKDTAERAPRLEEAGLRYLDCGTSGGPYGARHGACLMIGGHEEDFEEIESLFADVAQPDGYQFFEGPGAGHFVKMVHNGIEYGMMQAIAEGFQIMKLSRYELDLTRVADVYQNGSVIESRLIGWLEDAFAEMGEDLREASGMVGHTGEGAWTVDTADEMQVDARVIRGALEFRIESERSPSYAGQVLSALRNQFGGHAM